jgi:6,7-dimethyl-8-ribityllumazine synthase
MARMKLFLENEVPAEHIIRWNVPGLWWLQKMLQTQNVDAVML